MKVTFNRSYHVLPTCGICSRGFDYVEARDQWHPCEGVHTCWLKENGRFALEVNWWSC